MADAAVGHKEVSQDATKDSKQGTLRSRDFWDEVMNIPWDLPRDKAKKHTGNN